MYPNVGIEVDSSSCSDHLPLWLYFDKLLCHAPKIFRYEASWNLTEDCEEVFREAWGKETLPSKGLEATRKKLSKCQDALVEWSNTKNRKVQQPLNRLYSRLDQLQKDEQPGNLAEINQIQTEINLLLEMEDLRWRQRAKRNWYQHGDRNTQFFHAWAN